MNPDTQIANLSGNENFQEAAIMTILQQAYQNNLQFASMQIEQMLSSTNLMLQNFQSKLSAAPTHPYEYWKFKYLDSSKRPRTIHDLDFPQNFSPITATQQICAISAKYNDVMMTQLRVLSAAETSIEPTLNIFATLSGDQFVVNEEKMKAHIEFQETIRNLPLEEIEKNPVITACKIVNEFIKVYA